MKPKNKLLFGILAAVFLILMAFSTWKIWGIKAAYRKGDDSYEEISSMVSLPQELPIPQPVADTPTQTEAPAEDELLWPTVDFTALREINPDIVAWIYIEGTNISYPIVQGEDNSYYLKHLFSGEWNASGCIFLDTRNDAGFTDQNSVLYGHNMRNGAMFSALESYKQQAFFDEHPAGLLVTPDRNYKIAFFSGYVASSQDDAWKTNFTDAEFETWIERTVSRSCFSSETTPDAADHILTLSTCTYEFEGARFVLVGVLQ